MVPNFWHFAQIFRNVQAAHAVMDSVWNGDMVVQFVYVTKAMVESAAI